MSDELTEFGFTFGAMEVTRLADINGTTRVRIKTTAGRHIDVYVSPTGRSLRVFGAGEWKAQR